MDDSSYAATAANGPTAAVRTGLHRPLQAAPLSPRASAADQARAAWAARAANLTEHLAPLASGGGGGAAAYYNLFLSYSADFASGVPNPPGSGYHWSLQSTRLGLSAGFAARLAQRAQE